VVCRKELPLSVGTDRTHLASTDQEHVHIMAVWPNGCDSRSVIYLLSGQREAKRNYVYSLASRDVALMESPS
jgi:hypothetical protein